MYKERVHILSQDTIVQEISAPGLVDLIEQPQINDILLQETLMRVLSQFDPDIEALILGCTHYPIISREISRVWYTLFQRDIILIDPGAEAAKRFMDYLTRHTEMSLSQ